MAKILIPKKKVKKEVIQKCKSVPHKRSLNINQRMGEYHRIQVENEVTYLAKAL